RRGRWAGRRRRRRRSGLRGRRRRPCRRGRRRGAGTGPGRWRRGGSSPSRGGRGRGSCLVLRGGLRGSGVPGLGAVVPLPLLLVLLLFLLRAALALGGRPFLPGLVPGVGRVVLGLGEGGVGGAVERALVGLVEEHGEELGLPLGHEALDDGDEPAEPLALEAGLLAETEIGRA